MNRNGEFVAMLSNTNNTYEFSISDIEISYHLTENYSLTLKCKDSSNCIRCNSHAKLNVLPVMNFVFKEQMDAVKLYNKLKK